MNKEYEQRIWTKNMNKEYEQDGCISLSPGASFLRPPRSAPMWWNTCLGKIWEPDSLKFHCHSDPIWSNLIQSDPICHLDLLSTDCAYPCLRCPKSWFPPRSEHFGSLISCRWSSQRRRFPLFIEQIRPLWRCFSASLPVRRQEVTTQWRCHCRKNMAE